MKQGSLLRQLALTLGITLFLAAILMAVSVHFQAQEELDELLDEQLKQVAHTLLVLEIDEFEHEQPPLPSEHGQHRHHNHFNIVVLDPEGTPRLITPGTPGNLPHRQTPGFATVQLGHDQWRIYGAWSEDQHYFLQVAQQLDERNELLRKLVGSIGLPFLLLFPLLGLLLWLGIQQALKPIRALTGLVENRPVYPHLPLPTRDIPNELLPLVQGFNQLLLRIDQTLEQERRFTADAAHELRTPLAGLRLQAELALNSANDSERRHILQRLLDGSDRITRLLEQLLLLARLDSQQAVVDPQAFDLSALARAALGQQAGQILSKNMECDVQADHPALLQGQADLMALLLRNLLDNAIRYSPDAGSLSLTVTPTANTITLTVENSGDGLDPSVLARLGERFYRAGQQAIPGSGLGLSLVKRIATLHGGDVTFSASPLGGLRTEVRLPMARK